MKNRLIAAYQAKLISLFQEKFPSMKYSNMEGNIFQAILEVFYVNNLVEVKNNQVVVSSREIAKKFNKRHDHILRDLNDIKKDVPNFGEMFFETMLSDSYGRQQKVYLMTRDGFTLLAMGFTGKEALQWKLKYIAAFNEMEKQLSGKTANQPTAIQQKRAEAMLLNARSRQSKLWLAIAEKTDIKEYKHICQQKAAEVLSGTPVLPKPVANRKKTYSAAEIGEMFDDLVPAIETLLG